MTLPQFHDWAHHMAKSHPEWTLELVTIERDGAVVSCEAWFCENNAGRADVGQGYWRADGDVATF